MWRVSLLVWICCLTSMSNGQGQKQTRPPVITDFLEKNLVNPNDVKGPQEYNEKENQGFKLPCSAEGNNLEYSWRHNGSKIVFPNRKYTLNGGTLTGEFLKGEQSGNYQCFVKDTGTNKETFSRKLQLVVTYCEPFFDKSTDPIILTDVVLGSPYSIKCPPHGPNYGADYVWESKGSIAYKRAEHISISPITGELYFMFITQRDVNNVNAEGGKLCKVEAGNINYESRVITLQTTGTPDPGTNKSPSWKVPLKAAETATEGQFKYLYCVAIGRPAPKITWYKDNVQIVHDKNSYNIPESYFGRRLEITTVNEKDHEGRYTCEAENSENGGRPLTSTTYLEVKVGPKWRGQPPKPEIKVGIEGNVTILCDVRADPEPQYVWYKDGNQLTASTPKMEYDKGKLMLRNVGFAEDGVYQCVAENEIGMIVSSTWVEVQARKPDFSKGKPFGPFYLFKNSEAQLDCEPDAAPPPTTYRWYKNDIEIKSGNGYRLTATGSLIIEKVAEKDAGNYRCFAENIIGKDSATSRASVLERTVIVQKPQDKTVKEGDNADLFCLATYDKKLEITYDWKRDNADLDTGSQSNAKYRWNNNVLTISNIQTDEAGKYTCHAQTQAGQYFSTDSASAIINIKGVPFPPTMLSITSETCVNRTTTLRWVTSESNDAPIMHFLVEQDSTYEPNVFKLIYNVTNPNATSVVLNLTAWATLRFRMRAVNLFGPSRPSDPTAAGICRTSQAEPGVPKNLRGEPKKAEHLDIVWDAMQKIDWNAPGLYYDLNYRRVGGEPPEPWTDQRIPDYNVSRFSVPDPGYYKLWEFRIRAGNDVGKGKWSGIVTSHSGQDPPEGKPEDFSYGTVTARTVDLTWKPVAPTKGGSVDGYRIYYWGRSQLTARRRRRAIPANAESRDVSGGNTNKFTLDKLKPYSDYNIAIKAFNSGGEGPSSEEISFSTLEDVPGPPSDVEVYAFAKYILVTWSPPEEPNGVITKYRVGSAEYQGSEYQDVEVDKKELSSSERRLLLGDQKELTDYVVEAQAQTSPGWGESVRKTTTTVKMSPPAKPKPPKVDGTAIDEVKVTYIFDVGGGYTHDFLVMYRKKIENEEFVNTSWVNHFDTQDTTIGSLEPGLYEFKTVARNDLGESPASDITEARPQPGIVAGQRATTPIHKSAWFIALLVLIALLILALIILVLYTKHRGAKYPVGKRERKRAALIEREPYDEEEGPFNNGGAQENPPPYQSRGSLDKRESDRDSLDDYGEGPQFNEDGSFIEEYGDEKKAPPDDKDQSAFATFV